MFTRSPTGIQNNKVSEIALPLLYAFSIIWYTDFIVKSKISIIITFFLLLVLEFVSTPNWSILASDLANPYTGVARIDGPLQLDIEVTPAIGTAGDTLTLNLRLLNKEQITYSPAVVIQLPPGIQPEADVLGSGMIWNIQKNELTWLPIVSANGGVETHSIVLRVEVVDVVEAEQEIKAILQPNAGTYLLAEENITNREVSLPIWLGITPQINQVTSQLQVAVGQPIQLMADIAGSEPIYLSWDLGDGRRIDVNAPVVVYPAAGMYEVRVEATNALATISQKATIMVVPHPAAQFTADDSSVSVGETITFQNQSGGYPPLRYLWHFGDGTSSDLMNPSHAYSEAGQYQVQLTTENDFGTSDAFLVVSVGAPPSVEMVLPESANAGETVVGYATSNETNTSFAWDMGDGRQYEGVQVNHVYRSSGDYYVSLAAGNDYGSSHIGRWIRIDPGILYAYLPMLILSEDVIVPSPTSSGEPFVLDLEPVDLRNPFVLEPNLVPPGSTPSEQLFAYINQVRRGFALPPLTFVYELNQAAQHHSDDMSLFAYTGHGGADGSTPAERLLYFGYNNGYAGEATAWGFEHPYEAVEFWVNSEAHRRIILNRYATDLGVGYTRNFNAPNVWYWTAEFGNSIAPATTPSIRLQAPTANAAFVDADVVRHRWNWPLPLTAEQRFLVYLHNETKPTLLGTITEPTLDTMYELETAITTLTTLTQTVTWEVQLVEGRDTVVAASEQRPITIGPNPDLLITPTPVITITPTVTTTIASPPTPTATPTPTQTPPPTNTPVPRPTLPLLATTTPIAPSSTPTSNGE